MPPSYIVWFATFTDMVRDMKRRPPTKILAIGIDYDQCYYVGLACANGARYR